MTIQEFVEESEAAIKTRCDASYEKIQKFTKGNPLAQRLFGISKYECHITQLYALKKVVGFIINTDENDYQVLLDIMDKHFYEDSQTYDFVAVHREWEEYLEQVELEQ
jgi:hypothetical protein